MLAMVLGNVADVPEANSRGVGNKLGCAGQHQQRAMNA